MSTYKENGAEWMWILGAVGVAGAAFWWTHQASGAVPGTATAVSADQYAAVRSSVVAAVNVDQAGPASKQAPMTDAKIDTITQVWFRQDLNEISATNGYLKALGYANTVNLIAAPGTSPQITLAAMSALAAANPTNNVTQNTLAGLRTTGVPAAPPGFVSSAPVAPAGGTPAAAGYGADW